MSKSIEEIRRESLAKLQTRAVVIDREAVDEESRTVNVAFASDKPVEQWFGNLILSMDKKAVRTDRLASGAPLLMDHNRTDQIGVVENFSFDKDGMARADVRFDTDQRSSDIFNSVKNGIRRNVSVGFMMYALEFVSSKEGEPDLYRCDDWEPLEISIVAVPADLSAGVGRSLDDLRIPDKVSDPSQSERAISTKEEKTMTPEEIAAAAAAEEARRAQELAAANPNPAIAVARQITEWGAILGEPELARTHAAMEGASVETFMAAVRAKQVPNPTPAPESAASLAARTGGQGVQLARSIPRYAPLKNFKGEKAEERAYRFGQWLLGRALYSADNPICVAARKFCDENGLTRAMGETVNETGGYTVPPEFGNDLIDLREQYGVFRRNAKVVPMASDTRTDPRRTGGLTAYFPGEAGAITPSDMAWDQVELVAKKLAVLARYSSEVNEDSILNFGDTLAGEIAYAFAEKEDRCGFIGDGTSTYGGITGVTNKLLNLSATRANIAGLVVGTGNLFSELVIGDFEAVVGKLPQYADSDAAAWFVHRSFYWNVMVQVMLASGGVTAAEIEDARRQRFMGYRVEFTQVMPSVDANDQVCALFGDLAKAASFGTRRDTQIAFSEHSRFANDQIEIRGTERFDINVHDVGNQSSSAGSRVPGPIVGLLTAAS